MALISHATDTFWECYQKLPIAIQKRADKQFALWKQNPNHPSLAFKLIHRNTWSVRVTYQYRALCAREGEIVTWFWIGTHAEYDRLIQ